MEWVKMLKAIGTCLVAVSAFFFAITSFAQQSAKTSRIGFLGPTSQLDVFRNALADLGYAEGRNFAIDARWPEGERLDQLATFAEAFVNAKVDVIVAIGATAARAAKAATSEIPIAFAGVVNPVATGLVANLAKPDGNVTGATTFDPAQARLQVELLKEAIPGLTRVVILGDSGAAPALFQVNDDAARAAGLETVVVKVQRGAEAPDFEEAFAQATREGAQAAIVLSTPVTTPHRKRIAEASIRLKIPILSPRDHADAGGLLSFGTSFSEATRSAAALVVNVLKGAKPGELPIEMVKRHELVINHKTASELGLRLPATIVSRAHQVVQ
jgi:putative ABC transport system substrate-binding protein